MTLLLGPLASEDTTFYYHWVPNYLQKRFHKYKTEAPREAGLVLRADAPPSRRGGASGQPN